MSFQDMAEALDQACINLYGITGNLYAQSAPTTAIPIKGIIEKPSMLEELVPGYGTSVVRFFVGFLDITPEPRKGDIVNVNGTSYDVWEVEVDVVGGCTLKMRERGISTTKKTMRGAASIVGA